MAEIVIVKNADAAGELAAETILRLISRKPDAVLGVATGSTPLTTYQALARSVQANNVDVSAVRGFALDEYVGLPIEHPESYRSVITREVVEPLGLTPSLVHVPNGALEGIQHAGDAYEEAIVDAGGIDLQILGIGRTGHVGFNEPGSSLASVTRTKTLTEQTRIDNARFFDGDVDAVPTHCLTQGLATIMSARHIVLVAAGSGKAEAVHHLAEGGVSALWPGTILQHHPHVTVLVDEAAASRLQLASYYRQTYASKPAWQGL